MKIFSFAVLSLVLSVAGLSASSFASVGPYRFEGKGQVFEWLENGDVTIQTYYGSLKNSAQMSFLMEQGFSFPKLNAQEEYESLIRIKFNASKCTRVLNRTVELSELPELSGKSIPLVTCDGPLKNVPVTISRVNWKKPELGEMDLATVTLKEIPLFRTTLTVIKHMKQVPNEAGQYEFSYEVDPSFSVALMFSSNFRGDDGFYPIHLNLAESKF